VVPLPESVQLSPQTHAATLSGGNGRLSGNHHRCHRRFHPRRFRAPSRRKRNAALQHRYRQLSNYSFSSVPVGNYRLESQRPGFKTNVVSKIPVSPGENQLNSQLQVGTSSQTVEVTAAVNSLNTESAEVSSNVTALPGVANRIHVYSKLPRRRLLLRPALQNLDAAREMSSAATSGQDLGDLFEYKLKDRVTLGKNQSRSFPSLRPTSKPKKFSLWSGTRGSGRPLRALWVKNTSPLTLDAGSFGESGARCGQMFDD